MQESRHHYTLMPSANQSLLKKTPWCAKLNLILLAKPVKQPYSVFCLIQVHGDSIQRLTMHTVVLLTFSLNLHLFIDTTEMRCLIVMLKALRQLYWIIFVPRVLNDVSGILSASFKYEADILKTQSTMTGFTMDFIVSQTQLRMICFAEACTGLSHHMLSVFVLLFNPYCSIY